MYCYGVFKVRVDQCPREKTTRTTSGLSKLNSVDVEVDVVPGELGHRTAEAI